MIAFKIDVHFLLVGCLCLNLLTFVASFRAAINLSGHGQAHTSNDDQTREIVLTLRFPLHKIEPNMPVWAAQSLRIWPTVMRERLKSVAVEIAPQTPMHEDIEAGGHRCTIDVKPDDSNRSFVLITLQFPGIDAVPPIEVGADIEFKTAPLHGEDEKFWHLACQHPELVAPRAPFTPRLGCRTLLGRAELLPDFSTDAVAMVCWYRTEGASSLWFHQFEPFAADVRAAIEKMQQEAGLTLDATRADGTLIASGARDTATGAALDTLRVRFAATTELVEGEAYQARVQLQPVADFR